MVRIKWLTSSKQDLKEIYDYISLDSKRYAKLQIDKIYAKTQVIKKQMYIGKEVDEIKDASIREVIEGNYRIIYRIKSATEIHILMIHHGARDLRRRIKTLYLCPEKIYHSLQVRKLRPHFSIAKVQQFRKFPFNSVFQQFHLTNSSIFLLH